MQKFKLFLVFLFSLFFLHCEKEEFFKKLSLDKTKLEPILPKKFLEENFTQVFVNRKILYKNLFYKETFSDIQLELVQSQGISGYKILGITSNHIFRKLFQAKAGDIFVSLGGYPLENKSGLYLGFRTLFSNTDFFLELQRAEGKKELFKISLFVEETKSPMFNLISEKLKVILDPSEYSSFRAELSSFEFQNNGYLVPKLKSNDIGFQIGLQAEDLIISLDEHKLTEPHSLNNFFQKEIDTHFRFSILRAGKEINYEIINFNPENSLPSSISNSQEESIYLKTMRSKDE
jgi:hypothetical protein